MLLRRCFCSVGSRTGFQSLSVPPKPWRCTITRCISSSHLERAVRSKDEPSSHPATSYEPPSTSSLKPQIQREHRTTTEPHNWPKESTLPEANTSTKSSFASYIAPDIAALYQFISSGPQFLALQTIQTQYQAEREFAANHINSDFKSLNQDWAISLERQQYYGNLRSLLLGSFISSALQLLNVLAALPVSSDVLNFSTRANILFALQQCHRKLSQPIWDLDLPEVSAMFQTEVNWMKLPSTWPSFPPRYSHMKLLLDNSSMSQRDAILNAFLSKYCDEARYFDSRTYFRVVHHLLDDGDVDRAWKVFLAQPSELLLNPSKNSLAICSRLLTHDIVVDTPEGPNFKYLPQLLKAGFRLDNLLRTRLVERALEVGHFGVAWDLFHHMRSSNQDILPRTYLLLLRHSFLHANVDKVNELITTIHNDDKLNTHPPILAYTMNVVRLICSHERKMSVGEAIPQILALYDRAYKRDVLVKLGITDFAYGAETHKMDPTFNLLACTIWSCVLCMDSPRRVDQVWKWICHLAFTRDPDIEPLLSHPILYHAFLISYTRRASTLLNGLHVLQHMLDNLYCKPDIRAWSIMACGFLRFKKRQQAAQVVKMIFRSGHTAEAILRDARLPPDFFDLDNLERIMDSVLDERNLLVDQELMPSHEKKESSGMLDLADLSSGPASAEWQNFADLTNLKRGEDKAADRVMHESATPVTRLPIS